MKLTKTFFNLAIAAMAVGALASCNQELSDMNPGKDGLSSIKLVKTPEVYAWSGQETLSSNPASTRSTDMNANMWNKTWDCPPSPAEDLTDEELSELKALLSKGVETHNDIVIHFENYYVQQIYKGEDSYHSVDHCAREAYDGSGVIKCGGNNQCDHLTSGDHTNNDNIFGSDHMNKLLAYGSYGYEHVNNFNNGTNTNTPGACGCGEVHYKTTLMTGMPTSGIDPEKQFGFHETFGTNHDYFNYIIVEYKGYYYVGFDYEAHKYDQNTNNHGEAMDVFRDWNFTDWIVRITPAYHKGDTPDNNPGGIFGDPTTSEPEEETCEQCHHPRHDEDDCNICEEGTTCHPGNIDPGFDYIACPLCEHKLMLKDGVYVHVAGEQRIGVSCDDCDDEHPSLCSDNVEVEIPYEDAIIIAKEQNKNPGNTPSTPATPDKNYKHNNEVEVNLEIVDSHKNIAGGNKYGIEDLATKLSIHVRCATDVEIILPVPSKCTIASDDLYIFQQHYIDGEKGVYGGSQLEAPGAKVEYSIEGNPVTLYVQVMGATVNYPEGYMKVWTEGINDAVINYCMLHNGDGINFEVWTYYQTQSIDEPAESGKTKRDVLKGYLNQSTIEFNNNPVLPDYYINAFGYDYNGLNKTEDRNPDDCTVTPKQGELYDIDNPKRGEHLNGTPYNDIYVKKGVTADDDHTPE